MKRAWTLTQTLVALAIVLGCFFGFAFLFVNSTNAPKAAAKASTCRSNLKNLGDALAAYLSFNDDMYPGSDHFERFQGMPPAPDRTPSSRRDFLKLIKPYVTDENAFRCPEDRLAYPRRDPETGFDSKEAPRHPSSFAANGWMEYGLSFSQVSDSARWVAMGERNNEIRPTDAGWYFYWWQWQGAHPQNWPPSNIPDPMKIAGLDIALERHRGSPSWLFGDGHVKGMKLLVLWGTGKDNQFWPASNFARK